MKMLLCLHGNPFQGQEFDALIPSLQGDFNPVVVKRLLNATSLESLLQSINATAKVSGGGPFGIVAYSWGAYLALAYLNRFPENVTGIVLINPLVKETKKVCPFGKTLLSVPLVGTLTLKWRGKKMTANLLERTFSPEKPSAEVRKILEKDLVQPQVWRGSLKYKKLMLSQPLPTLAPSTCKIKVLYGARDSVAPMEEQQPSLASLMGVETVIIPNAGHALPWTHTATVLDAIRDHFNP
jgi:pimeloyl-ACP methyl ester carboxylesterase